MESLISIERLKNEDPEKIQSSAVSLYNEYTEVPESLTTIRNKYTYVKECVSELFKLLNQSVNVKDTMEMLNESSKIEITKIVMNGMTECTVYLKSWTRDAIFVIKDKVVTEFFTQETNQLGL
jgi:hypothetical protein